MAIWVVHAPPGQGRADGYTAFLVSTATDTATAARIKSEKLVGLYDGSGAPTHFRDYRAIRIRSSGHAFDGVNFVPDICFQGARVIGPRFLAPFLSIADVWPRLGRGGRFLRGAPWVNGQD